MPDVSTEVAIATSTLSGSGVITFSSISSAYTDLRLVILSTGNMGNIGLRFNSDSATNYSDTFIRGNGSAASSSRDTAQNYAYITNLVSNITVPALTTTDIFSYAGSTYKTILSNRSSDYNGSGKTGVFVNLWRSTAAINRVDAIAQGGNWIIGTTFTLYGIKAA